MNSSTQLDDLALLLQHQLIVLGLDDRFDDTLWDFIDSEGDGWKAAEKYAALVDNGISFINQRLNTTYEPFGMKTFKVLQEEEAQG